MRRLGLSWLQVLSLCLLLLLAFGSWELQEWFGGALERSARALLYDKLTSANIRRHRVSRRSGFRYSVA